MLTIALGACGTRGPLFLPPVQNKPATAPASTAKPAATTPASADRNTPEATAQ